jgi:hypothetical protein
MTVASVRAAAAARRALVNSGEAHLGSMGGHTLLSSVEITTTHTQGAYIAGDAVLQAAGGLTELTGVARVAGGSGYIKGLRISTNKKSLVPELRVHFFNVSNPTIAADNAQWKDLYADVAKRVAFVDLPAMTTAIDSGNSDMSRTFTFDVSIPFVCVAGSTSLWIAIETKTGFTPDNDQKFTIKVNTEVN